MTAPRHGLIVEADAINRATRTFIQGLAVDVATALVLALATAFSDDLRWTRTYWLGIAALLLKTIVTSIASYIARRQFPPTP